MPERAPRWVAGLVPRPGVVGLGEMTAAALEGVASASASGAHRATTGEGHALALGDAVARRDVVAAETALALMRATGGEGSVVGVLAWVADEAGGESEVVAHGVVRKRGRRRSGMVAVGGQALALEAGRHSGVEDDVVGAVASVVGKFIGECGWFVRFGCEVLKRAAEEGRAAEMLAADGVAVLVRALDQGVVTGDVNLVREALQGVASVCRGGGGDDGRTLELVRIRMRSCGGLGVVVRALRVFSVDKGMVSVGLGALLAAIEGSSASAAEVGEIGADDVVRFLATLVDGEERGISFVTADGTALSSGRSEGSGSSAEATSSVEALSSVAPTAALRGKGDGEAPRFGAVLAGIEPVQTDAIDACKVSPEHQRLLMQVADLLQSLTLVEANRQALLRHRGIVILVNLVRELSPSARAVPPAMLALWRCLVGNENAAAQACVARAAPVIVAAMQRHQHRRPVQRLGIALLVLLTELNDANRHVTCASGGVAAVLFALTEHNGSDDIVARSCRFMLLLSPMNIISSGVSLASLSRVVMLRRERHKSSPVVQRSTQDLLESLRLVPLDVSGFAAAAPLTSPNSSGGWMAFGKNGDIEDALRRERNGGCMPGGSRLRTGGEKHGNGLSSIADWLGQALSRKKSSSFIDPPDQGGDLLRNDLPGTLGQAPACGTNYHRTFSFGRSKPDGNSHDRAVEAALKGESARWMPAAGSTSFSSSMRSRSSLGSGRFLSASRRRNHTSSVNQYSSATQYIAMRPLISSLRDARDRVEQLHESMHNEEEADPQYWEDTEASEPARVRPFSAPHSGVVNDDIQPGHAPQWNNVVSDGEGDPARLSPVPAVPAVLLHQGSSPFHDSMGEESPPRVLGYAEGAPSSPGETDEEVEYDPARSIAGSGSPGVGSGMTSAGKAHRPVSGSQTWMEVVNYGSGRRGESGSLCRSRSSLKSAASQEGEVNSYSGGSSGSARSENERSQVGEPAVIEVSSQNKGVMLPREQKTSSAGGEELGGSEERPGLWKQYIGNHEE